MSKDEIVRYLSRDLEGLTIQQKGELIHIIDDLANMKMEMDRLSADVRDRPKFIDVKAWRMEIGNLEEKYNVLLDQYRTITEGMRRHNESMRPKRKRFGLF